MNKELFKKEMDSDDSSIASRRKFLKQIAYGSLLSMGGSSVASAAVRNVIYPAKRGQSHTQQVSHNIKASHVSVNHGHAHGQLRGRPHQPRPRAGAEGQGRRFRQ